MKAIIAAAFGLLPIGAPVFSLRPVCRPLSDEDLKSFTTPIEQRTDKDFWVKIFQKRGDRWFQSKTWISRQFFFRGAKEKGAGTARAFSLSEADAYCFGAAGAGAGAAPPGAAAPFWASSFLRSSSAFFCSCSCSFFCCSSSTFGSIAGPS